MPGRGYAWGLRSDRSKACRTGCDCLRYGAYGLPLRCVSLQLQLLHHLMGNLSVQEYAELDCKLFRFKALSVSSHKEPMGGGTGRRYNIPDKEWNYPTSNSSIEIVLKAVCSQQKINRALNGRHHPHCH